MAKQTFTTGQVLTAAQMTSLQQTAMGGGSATAKTANYVLVAADAGTTVSMNAAGATTITVNTSLFAAGDTVTIQNLGAGTTTITAGTATVNTSSSLALAQYEGGQLYFVSASAAIFFKSDGAAASAASMTLLNAGGTTLSGASTAVSFTSTGYTGLKIILKDVYVTVDAVAYFTLNNDGNSNYSFAIVRGAGSVTRESNPSFGAYYYLFQTLPTSNTTLLNGNGQIDLFFPNDTDNVSFTVNTLGGSTGNLTVSNGMGTYNSSAVISRIDFFIASGSFSGGKAYVYGVK